MDSNFRKLALRKIAASAGILSSFVEKTLKPEKEALEFSSLQRVGPGTTVMSPSNVVKPDGSVDIIINIRGIAGGDKKTITKLGQNAVIITAEAGGIASKENVQRFGNAAFINQAVDNVLAQLQAKYPDKKVKRGKLVISGFSGGGPAIVNILTQRNQINGNIDAVIINDGLHADPKGPGMQAVLEYAREAAKGNGKLRIMNSAIKPGSYTSTTEASDYLIKQLEIDKSTQIQNAKEFGIEPYTQAIKGGVEITALYGPDRANDAYYKDNRPGSLGDQHVQSLRKGHPYLFRSILA